MTISLAQLIDIRVCIFFGEKTAGSLPFPQKPAIGQYTESGDSVSFTPDFHEIFLILS
jgi:hypothetical protein